MRAIAWLVGFATLAAATGYMIVSLNRWEWNRALFFGLVVVIAEVALATALVLRRLGHLSAEPTRREVDALVRRRLVETKPRRDRFAWLDVKSGQMSVFITFLVAGGVVISGLAWLVDKIAAKTTSKVAEERLAADLTKLSYPRGGLIVDDITVLAEAVPGCNDPQLRKLLRRAGAGGLP